MRRNDWVMLGTLLVLGAAADVLGFRPAAITAGMCTGMFVHLCDRKPAA